MKKLMWSFALVSLVTLTNCGKKKVTVPAPQAAAQNAVIPAIGTWRSECLPETVSFGNYIVRSFGKKHEVVIDGKKMVVATTFFQSVKCEEPSKITKPILGFMGAPVKEEFTMSFNDAKEATAREGHIRLTDSKNKQTTIGYIVDGIPGPTEIVEKDGVRTRIPSKVVSADFLTLTSLPNVVLRRVK